MKLRRHIRIVLTGLLNDANLGDQAIFQITEHFIQEYSKSHRMKVTFYYVDIGEYKVPRYRREVLNKYYEKIRNRIWRFLLNRPFTKYDRVKFACKRNIKRSSGAVIFVGGGLIKFKQQEYLHKMIEIVLSRADQMNVPVMFSGVGVEGYDDKNEICARLKVSLNRKCVKVITVRDDIETLRTFYLSADSCVRTVKVFDAACSLKKLYPPSSVRKNIVGLGVIRSEIFAEYGNYISDDSLCNLYVDIYHQIVKHGKECMIFTNGAPKDQNFAERLASRLTGGGGKKTAKILCPRPQAVVELVDIITQFEAVIVTRLHAAVIAYAYSIPLVGLVWNQKQRFFGENIGLSDRFFDVSEFDAERIVKKLLCAIDVGYPDDMQAYRDSNTKEIENFLSEYTKK